jgi:hypothetical protein
MLGKKKNKPELLKFNKKKGKKDTLLANRHMQ